MNRVSSSLTILIRIGIPTMWFAFVLSIMILLSVAVSGRAQFFSNPILWISILFILGSGMTLMYLVFWKFYRVDMDRKFVYVSNYFRTFKYSFNDIESIKGISLFPDRIFKIRLKSKGSFGRNIYFLASQKLWEDFISEHAVQLENILLAPKSS
jgi:magnesium-transporting ATPase (P-type)